MAPRLRAPQNIPRPGTAHPASGCSTSVTGVDPEREMRWTEYIVGNAHLQRRHSACSPTWSSVQHFVACRCQPAAPRQRRAALALNTAISFTTNTNWQAYTPESTMSYLTQMLGLATHNFWSAAVGMALAVAFMRGIARREAKTLGNFWVDLTRGTLWILAADLHRVLARRSFPRALCRTSGPTTPRSSSKRRR